ncbi:acyl-CoA thioesterase [Oceanobacillus senegalensis]|uniref:acyl-CoA thioesterase n=1 Tax=Oceanobacillus senegalensis TaxID=1936063 RepID=UPI000A30FFAA|nr:thioesterase family protein [Oceanobacillus senegalensis]
MTTAHEIEVYIRFAETDALGHVNNTSYFLYFEEARTKFFKEILPERNKNLSFILASIKCQYLNQAFAGQTLRVCTNVLKVGTKSFTMSQTILSPDTGITIAEAEAVTVCFNYLEQKTISIPERLRLKLENHLIVGPIY